MPKSVYALILRTCKRPSVVDGKKNLDDVIQVQMLREGGIFWVTQVNRTGNQSKRSEFCQQ